MSKHDKLMDLAPTIYDSVMAICEDAMEDDNQLETLSMKMQLHYEKLITERYGV